VTEPPGLVPAAKPEDLDFWFYRIGRDGRGIGEGCIKVLGLRADGLVIERDVQRLGEL
jgi:hypothetical protein